ncbi:MAG: DNA-binding NtrC family response regulator [Pseudomonadales bacterium]|jgi:DNA-binding NtrC family response regulator
MSNNDYDAVVSDVRMAGVSGVDGLQYAKDNSPKAIRIALTGFADETKR